MPEPVFSDDGLRRLRQAIDRAVPFLERSNYPLGVAWVNHRWNDGSPQDVIDALTAYQQSDGGFSGLEVDIKAPVSNAFAGRLAMHVLLSLRERPDPEMVGRLGSWYAANQQGDGDWHFPPEVYEHDLAPWFESWEFPQIHPSCSIAGLTHAFGIATPEMLQGAARIWEEQATLGAARSGDFYPMLPIIEYTAHIDVEDCETWLDALAVGVQRGIAANSFGDAEHALEHIVGGGPNLIVRLDRDDLVKVIDAVLADQKDDGGWPTPYNQDWRPWTTANTLVLLSELHDTIV